jgi:hypothetical protein
MFCPALPDAHHASTTQTPRISTVHSNHQALKPYPCAIKATAAAPFQHKTIRRRPQFLAALLFVLKQRGRRRICVGRVRCCPEFAAAVREKKEPRKSPYMGTQ